MPKSKNRKKHNQKVRSRKIKEKERKNIMDKMQKKMMQDLINKESQQGKFDNIKNIDTATNSNDSEYVDNENKGFEEGPLL